ncbi:hypothetical protein BVRB_042030, partial [Beta vulgaris subsp. vulgaris]
MWSLGVILYIILSGTAPFYDGRGVPIFDQIKSGDYEFPRESWEDVSEEGRFGNLSEQSIVIFSSAINLIKSML